MGGKLVATGNLFLKNGEEAGLLLYLSSIYGTIIMQEVFFDATRGQSLYSAHWACKDPRAVVLLIHGQGEHIGRYRAVADFFHQRRVAVWGFDQQGYGRSGGQRGHADGLKAYLDDLGLFISRVKREYPSVPLILYGHSMGGNIVLNYALRAGDTRIKAVVATGPWIRLAFEPPAIKVWSGRLMRYVLPTLSLPTGLDTRLLSRDEEVVRRYDEDSLVHDRVSAAAGIALMEGASWLNRYSGAIAYPTLLMHGGADGITAAAATSAFASRLSGDVLYKEWPGLYHEIHNEPERGVVLEYLWTWLENWLGA